MTKPGTPAERNSVAGFAREYHSRFPKLLGGWTRKEWNRQVRIALRKKLSTAVKKRVTSPVHIAADALPLSNAELGESPLGREELQP